MSEPIKFNATLIDSTRNLIAGDGQMRVGFAVKNPHETRVFELFSKVNKLLTVTVSSAMPALTDIAFRCSIPQNKTAIGGLKQFGVWFDVPLSDMHKAAKFYVCQLLPEPLTFTLEITEGDNLPNEQPVKEKQKREKKEPEPKGEHGKAWNCLFATGFENNFKVMHWYGGLPSDDKERRKVLLRARLDVESLTFVSMDDLIARLNKEMAHMCSDEQWSAIVRQINKAREAQSNE
jgi:hypothetical protein